MNAHADPSIDRLVSPSFVVTTSTRLTTRHPVPWIEEPVRSPTPPAPVQEPEPEPVRIPTTDFSYYRFVFGHKPFSTVVDPPVSFFSERFGRWISLAGELPTPHHTPTETPLLEKFDGCLYFPLVYHKVSTTLKEPQSLYQDAWRAFIGYESPSLKRKYSETVDLVEDDAEEPNPNDVSAEEVSCWQEYEKWKRDTRQKRRRTTKECPSPVET